MKRGHVRRVWPVVSLAAAAVLVVVTVVGLVTGAGFSPVMTGLLALSAAFTGVHLAVRGERS